MSKHALIITNDTHMLGLIERLLSSVQIEIALLPSLRKAAQYLKTEPAPQFIVLDLSLNDPQVITFLKEMRAIERFADLPVLVTVGEPDPDVIKEAFQAGADRYLTKTFIKSNFLGIIREMLTKSKK